jgi:hypothetical protein
MQGEAELQNKGTRNDDFRSEACCSFFPFNILKSLFVCSIFPSSAYPAPTTAYCAGFAENYFRSGAQD